MGRFWNWFAHGEPLRRPRDEDSSVAVEEPSLHDPHGLYVGPPITEAQAARIEAQIASGTPAGDVDAGPDDVNDFFQGADAEYAKSVFDGAETDAPPQFEDDELPDDPAAYDEPEPDPDVEPDEYAGRRKRGWARRGEPYNHFRTAKIVESGGGFKFTIKGRGGKRLHKGGTVDGGGYSYKHDAKKAALRWVNAQDPVVPTRFVDDQYDGAIIVDVPEELARPLVEYKPV